MKKVLLGAVAVLGMVSCSENEVLTEASLDAISFSNAQFGNSIITKAGAPEVNLGVYCYRNNEPYFSNIQLSPNAGGTEWSLNPTQYWPNENITLFFWAYGPYSNDVTVLH